MKKKWVIATTIIIGLVIVYFLLPISNGDNKLVLKIGDHQIEMEEFNWMMNQQKKDIQQYFYKEYGVEPSNHYWFDEINGEYPYQRLADQTVIQLREMYASYELAKEQGYINEVGFNPLINRWEQENEARAQKNKKGEPVYGLATFTFDLFVEYELDTLEKLYLNDLENPNMMITDQEVNEYYERNKEILFKKSDDVHIEFVRIYYANLNLSEEEINQYKEELQTLANNMTKEEKMSDIIDNYSLLQPYYEEIDILSYEYSSYARGIGDVLAIAQPLEKREISNVIDQNGSLYLIHMIDKIEYHYHQVEEVRDQIRKAIREERFENYIEERANQLNIDDDKEAIYEYTKEQLSVPIS